MKRTIAQIADVLKRSRSIFIAGHERPDGDTAGSALALAHALGAMKKKVSVFTKEPLPEYLKFLPGSSLIKRGAVPPSTKYDAAVILECSDLARMGNLISPRQARTIINIDHHLVSASFGDINWIEPDSSATCLMILRLLKKMGAPITKKIAECLYTGMLTDTGRFVQQNTTPETLEAAAELMRNGADPAKVSSEVFANKSMAEIKLLSRALSSTKTYLDGRLAVITINARDFRETGATWRDTEGFVNFPIMLRDSEVAAFIREVPDVGAAKAKPAAKGVIKVSMRSKKIDLTPIVTGYGGGGHKHAAGFSFNSTSCASGGKRSISIAEATAIVARATAPLIKK
ncbi:MAG: bifunctional oligoribonuclease/PAP phosphatase NrnA [Elusimicrobia bacterium HGW-Elusimicrobia-1]|jgi:phosphoesterase RecJ-like protein|nr:MAG: bifunctional oligoribonuclease/PAP phosphatase NrnA [Elusimicrobia bacterium HGW-Elusimicrobia-1]